MCLTVKIDEPIKQSTKNMIVFKALDGNGMSNQHHWRGYYYKKMEVQPIVSMRIQESGYSVSKKEVYEAYHSYKNWSFTTGQIFIIPKGTAFIKGKYNSLNIPNYASETIVRMGHWFNPMTYVNIIRFISKK